MSKSAQDFLSEANSMVPSIAVEEALSLINSGKAVVIDVRDGKEIDQSGTVKNALRPSWNDRIRCRPNNLVLQRSDF